MTLESIVGRHAGTTLDGVRVGGFAHWLLLFAVGMTVVGCKERAATEDEFVAVFAVSELERMLQRDYLPLRYRERARAALREFNSKEPNTVPIFVYAILTYGNDPNYDTLGVMCFDKDRDLQGIRIREQLRDSQGALTAIEEDYPIFVGSLESWSLERRVISFAVRDSGQRKDEKRWLEYENRWLKVLVREAVAAKRKQSAPVADGNLSVRDMPPLYVSVPDPNRVDVQMRAYDKAGNESEWIEVHAHGERDVTDFR